MATSGSFNTGSVGNFYFTIAWSRTGYSSVYNEHYIYYEVIAHNTPGSYRTVYLKSLSINSSSEYYNTSGVRYYDGDVVTSGSKTISSSNNAGDGSLSISFEAGVGITPGSNCSGSDSWSLDRIPRQATVTGATDFNDEGNPTITYNNPGGLRINARLEFAGTSIQRDNIGNSGSYTFSLTSAERQLLRQKCTGNSMTVREVIATCVDGSTESFWDWQDKTMTIVNANPTFTTFTYKDVGGISTQLTGNNQIIINDFNVVKVVISTANKAVANKGATMVKYRAVCGNVFAEQNYSASSTVELQLDYITKKTITVYAIDSRGNSKSVSLTISPSKWKDYTNLKINSASATRQNGIGTTTTLQFAGKIWKTQDTYDFGAAANEIIACKYRYKKTSENQYGSYINVTPTIDSSGNYSFSSTIAGDLAAEGFSLTNSFNFQLYVQDSTTRSATYNFLLGAGSPALAIHKNGVAFGAPYNTSIGGAVQINELLPAISDTVMMFSTAQTTINVSTAWTAIKMPFTNADVTGTALSYDATNKRIIVNKKGYVDIFGQLNIYTSGYLNGDYSMYLYKNGISYTSLDYQYINSSKSYDKLSGALFGMYVNAGDYIEMYVSYGNTGTVKTFGGSPTSMTVRYRRG